MSDISDAVTVVLPWHLAELAAYAGMKRQLLALHDARPDRYGFKERDPWATHIDGAGAELAVALELGLFWTPWARRPSQITADVGENVQVRNRTRPGGDLIVHRSDPDDHLFVHVVGRLPEYHLMGWLAGREAKLETFWGDPHDTGRPAYWIPVLELHPLADLPSSDRQSVA